MQILLVEDEPKIAAFIQKGLSENGYELTIAYDGKLGLSMALQGDYDLIILDIMLPFINGLDVCKQLRAEDVNTPILMLTALGTLDDKVTGLQQGADDYLVKPFHFKELIARIQALTRRKFQQNTSTNTLRVADLLLDRNSKYVQRDNKEIALTAKEYALLEMFMQNNNRLLSRSAIAEHVWGYDFDSNSNVIDVYINYLRNKIEKEFSSKLIHTIVGMGYIMKEK
jgi:two-component system, OmpR family, copper resistance phosphate regulon response regulator CusR